MRSNRTRVLFVGVVGLVLTAGAFRSAYAGAPGAPCTLLTQEQIDGVLGVKVGAPQTIGETACQWTATDQPAIRVTVELWDVAGYPQMKTPLPGITRTPVSGIGDDAFYTTVGQLTTLTVKKDQAAFVVRIYGEPTPSSQKDMEKALALDVIAKL